MLFNIRYLFPRGGEERMGFFDAMVTDLTDSPLTYVLAVMLLLAGGVVTLFVLRQRAPARRQITWAEFGVVAAIIVFIQVPLVNVATAELARGNAVGGYQELWGGSYTFAHSDKRNCGEDSTDCGETRPCHSYQDRVVDYVETVPDRDTYDKKTKTYTHHSHTVTHYKYVTRYHQCPYISFMTTWLLKDSFGDERTVDTTVPLQPQRFEGAFDFAGHVSVPHGPPAFWQEVKDALDRGEVVPAQKVNYYPNPLLAAQADQLENFSDKVKLYRDRKLLVDHTANVHDPITKQGYAQQVMFVRQSPPNAADFQLSLGRQNAELGGQRQGDMNVVAVRDSDVNSGEAHDYANALKAYWQSPDYGKEGLAKNAIMVVLGVSNDFKTITWSEARTGINFGNNAMLLALQNDLSGKPFDPQGLFGSPTQTVDSKGKVTYHHSSGLIEKIVMEEYAFKRPCMITCDKGQEGGFEYVSASVMMTTGDFVLLYAVNILIGGILFLLVALVVFDREFFARKYRFVRNKEWRSL